MPETRPFLVRRPTKCGECPFCMPLAAVGVKPVSLCVAELHDDEDRVIHLGTDVDREPPETCPLRIGDIVVTLQKVEAKDEEKDEGCPGCYGCMGCGQVTCPDFKK